MKLIDADALEWNDASKHPEDGPELYLKEEDIDNAPEIEAVPFDFIRKFGKSKIGEEEMALFESCGSDYNEWLIESWIRETEKKK